VATFFGSDLVSSDCYSTGLAIRQALSEILSHSELIPESDAALTLTLTKKQKEIQRDSISIKK